MTKLGRWNKASPEYRQHVKEYKRGWYLRNGAKRRAKAKEVRDRNLALNRQYVRGYLTTHHCVDCGESDPIVLDFDHVRGKKIDVVTRMMRNVSLEKVKREIDKCEIRCANCHRRVTHKRRVEKIELESFSGRMPPS